MSECGCSGVEAFVDGVVGELGGRVDAVIPILHRIQAQYNFLPEEALRRVCETTEITPARVVSVATFYSSFRFKPAGEHRIKVCIGTACHVKGAGGVFDAFKRALGIGAEEDTDADRRFTVEKVACLGCCMLAPAVQIDDITYGYVEPAKVGEVLGDFLKSASSGERVAGRGETGEGVPTLRICTCSSCQASGALNVFHACEERVLALGLAAVVKSVSCTGVSFQAPLLEIDAPDGETYRYAQIQPRHVDKVLLRHLRPASPHHRARHWLTSLLERVVEGDAYEAVTRYCVDVRDEVVCDYEGGQHCIATEMGGHLDPLDLAEYHQGGGFTAYHDCLAQKDPEAIVDRVMASGLRGRGGGGFSTGSKWAMTREAQGDEKVLICNGDEGDPGAFMDRMLMESFPFRVIEGMMIAGFAVGAGEGILYIRHEYGLAIKRMARAIEICRSEELLGEAFDLRIVEGAGAFVCGEETALIASVEGERGNPRYRPPYPATAGLWGRPTLINNAETLALIPWILRHG
ncbi:MAG: NAD(P)H-dependent oxidoreductase subunit E, partial [Planctomycetota bacterium]